MTPTQETPWYKSRTAMLGYLSFIILVLADPAVMAVIPLEWAPRIAAVGAVAVIAYRKLYNAETGADVPPEPEPPRMRPPTRPTGGGAA